MNLNEFCHFLYTKRALSRSPATNGISTESFWSTQDSLVEDIRNATGMHPYLTVSYTNLSTEARVSTPRLANTLRMRPSTSDRQ